MANKIKYNLKNVYISKVTRSTNGGYTYAAPVALPGAVNLSVEPQGETNTFYADGMAYYRSVTNNGYTGELEVALIPDWFRKDILGETADTNNVLFENADTSANPIYFAMLFEFSGDDKAIRHILYNCMVSEKPTISSQTKETTVEPVTESFSFTADPREDGLVKAKTTDETTSAVYTGWFTSVYVPAS